MVIFNEQPLSKKGTTVIPQDLQKLDRYIQSDMEMTKSKYHSGLTQIAKQYGLDISSKVVRDALVAAYKLGQKENSVRNKKRVKFKGCIL